MKTPKKTNPIARALRDRAFIAKRIPSKRKQPPVVDDYLNDFDECGGQVLYPSLDDYDGNTENE